MQVNNETVRRLERMTMQESFEVLVPAGVALLGAVLTLMLALALSGHRQRRVAAERHRPRRIGPYLLLEQIAAGAMGRVYRARHVPSGRLLALKFLNREATLRQHAQFDNEVRFGSMLSHPGSVAAQDHGKTADGTRYFAMELCEGVTLQTLVEREGPQPPERVIGILLQVAAALAEVHELGLVHRDVKPDNLLLCSGAGPDRVKLLDFGLVKHVDEPPPQGASDQAVGTPLYISPEALTSPRAMDGRSDLYALGAVAHFLLSGAPVFSGGSLLEIFSQHLVALPEPLSHLVGWSMPNDLERVVLDCLAKAPSARPSSARELMRRLDLCADASGAANERQRPAAREEPFGDVQRAV
jgi:eukaryotic-like serine/threonine-protein kinase